MLSKNYTKLFAVGSESISYRDRRKSYPHTARKPPPTSERGLSMPARKSCDIMFETSLSLDAAADRQRFDQVARKFAALREVQPHQPIIPTITETPPSDDLSRKRLDPRQVSHQDCRSTGSSASDNSNGPLSGGQEPFVGQNSEESTVWTERKLTRKKPHSVPDTDSGQTIGSLQFPIGRRFSSDERSRPSANYSSDSSDADQGLIIKIDSHCDEEPGAFGFFVTSDQVLSTDLVESYPTTEPSGISVNENEGRSGSGSVDGSNKFCSKKPSSL